MIDGHMITLGNLHGHLRFSVSIYGPLWTLVDLARSV